MTLSPEQQWLLLNIISLVIIIVCLLVVIWIGFGSVKQFTSSEIEPIFKHLFRIQCIISSTAFILFIIALLCNIAKSYLLFSKYYWFSGVICIYLHAIILLLVLSYRLYHTFKQSEYALSNPTKSVLIIIFSCNLAIFAWCCVVFYFWNNGITFGYFPILPPWIFAVVWYTINTCVVIIIFAQKLVNLAGNRIPSIHQYTDCEPELKAYQINLIRNTTRYVSLLVIGIFVKLCVGMFAYVWMCSFDSITWNQHFTVYSMIASIDCVVGLVCLYLQHSFAKSYYEKHCKCLYCCNSVFTKQATNKMKKRHKESMEYVVTMSKSASSNTKDNVETIIIDDQKNEKCKVIPV